MKKPTKKQLEVAVKKLARTLKQKSLSYSKAGKLLGVTGGMIGHVLKGRRSLPVKWLARLDEIK